jgi:hypothetical protein
MDWNKLLDPGTLAMLIPILGIIWWIIASVIEHRERMAMIANGINPDAVKDAGKEANTFQVSGAINRQKEQFSSAFEAGREAYREATGEGIKKS